MIILDIYFLIKPLGTKLSLNITTVLQKERTRRSLLPVTSSGVCSIVAPGYIYL